MLSQKFPEKGRELQVITGVYVQARYGRKPATGEELRAAKEAWEKIKLVSQLETKWKQNRLET